MEQSRRVGLLVGTLSGYGRRVLRGIASYVPRDGAWSFSLEPGEPADPSAREVSGLDGLIIRGSTDILDGAAEGAGVPAVNVSGWLRETRLPRVMADNRRVGRLAARHLLERGFERFAYYGMPGLWGSDVRQDSFVGEVGAAGFDVALYRGPEPPRWESTWEYDREALARWVASLEPPVGIFCCTDEHAWKLTEACREAHIAVPAEAAVVGVDNDDVLCDLAKPRLSSVDLGQERIGYEAAALLDRLIHGDPPPEGPILVPPKGIVERASSDIYAAGDPEFVRAVTYVRDHADRPITVEDVLGEVSVSRRTLERRFRGALGRTIAAEIRRVHAERAKRLLAETDLSMPDVARACGFEYPQRLSIVFKQVAGMTPTAYRRRFRWR